MYEEMKNQIFENQIDAITRAIVLIGKCKKVTFNDITRALSQAEIDAKFMCGLEMLHKNEDVKKQLLEHLTSHEFITVDDEGHINLTPKGLERSKKELPPEIEKHL